jgi:hypothetical protein
MSGANVAVHPVLHDGRRQAAARAGEARNGESYFGIDISADGSFVVAERANGAAVRIDHFPAGELGMRALRNHIERESAHPHVCIRACGGGLGLASALLPLPGIEVTLLRAEAIGTTPATSAPPDRAVRLARLAERLF